MKNIKDNRILLYLVCVIITGIAVRYFFYFGHVFSDDAYYSYLSYTLYKGEFAKDYIGYPVFLLRVIYLFITAISFKLFGTNETATIVFPFLISIVNLLLTYKLAKLFTKNEAIAITASLLMAFFPTDVVFATINFADAPNIFFINLGVYFLYKSYLNQKINNAVIGGLSLAFSMQIKENIYYIFILLILLLFYLLLKRKTLNFQVIIALACIILNVFIEGIVYLFLHNDFLYRFTILNQNYQFSYYDFFPYTAQKFSGVKSYWRNLFDQIFMINTRSVFLRRFYLFLPIVASVQSYFNIKKKANILLTFWFIGTLLLMLLFTTSFTEYKPLDLRRSWYIYPLLMPMVILSAQLINRFTNKIKFPLLIIYITGSLIMCRHYEIYFDKDNLSSLKSFLSNHQNEKIFTDHFTKYSIDLIRNYSSPQNSERISGKVFDWSEVKKGDWILYNRKHIDELKMQGYNFPNFALLKNPDKFRLIKTIGDFKIFEKRF